MHCADALYPVHTLPASRLFRDEPGETGPAGRRQLPGSIREGFVGRDAAHAAATSRGPLLFKYRAYASWGQGETAGSDFDAAFDDFAKDRFLIGEAEQVKEEILRYAEIARTDHILLRVQWPGLAHEEALGNIKRIGGIIAALS